MAIIAMWQLKTQVQRAIMKLEAWLSRQISTCSMELEVVWNEYGYAVAILKWQNLQSFHQMMSVILSKLPQRTL